MILDLPPTPAIILKAESWENQAGLWLAGKGLSLGDRITIIRELKRLRGESGIDGSLNELSKWAGVKLSAIPGLLPILSRPGSVPFEVDFYDVSSGTGSSLSYPSGIQEGDLCIVYHFRHQSSGGSPSIVNPSGFSTLASDSATSGSGSFISGARIMAHYKVLDGSESSISSVLSTRAIALVFRANKIIGVVNPQLWGAWASSGANRTLASGSLGTPLIVTGAMIAASGTVTGSTSPTMTQLGASPALAHYLIYALDDTPANVTTYDVSTASFQSVTLGALGVYALEDVPEYKIYRWSISAVRGTSSITQVSEFILAVNGVPLTMSAATATNPGGGSPSGEGPQNSLDGNTATKWLANDYTAPLFVEFPTPVKATQFTFTTANDVNQRDPRRWQLHASNDGSTWTLIHDQSGSDFVSTTTRQSQNAWLPLIL